MPTDQKTDFDAVMAWLSTEVRVSRKLLVAGGILALLLIVIALD